MSSTQENYTETLTELNWDLRKVGLKEDVKQTEGKIVDAISEGSPESGNLRNIN